MTFTVETIFSEEEINNLKDLYNLQDESLAHQDYNLFNVDKRHVRSQTYTNEILKLNQYAGMRSMGHYFVKYVPDSFTRIHSDNNEVVGKTIVTLVDTVDLVGGETLMFDVYPRQPRPSNKYAKRTDKDVSYDQDIVPLIVPMVDGQSVVYDHNIRHGVCKVHSGHRIVLVSWYATDSA